MTWERAQELIEEAKSAPSAAAARNPDRLTPRHSHPIVNA